jgi:hypothetical protein
MLDLCGFNGYTDHQLQQVTVVLSIEVKLMCSAGLWDVKQIERFQFLLKLLRHCLIYQKYGRNN